MAILEDGGYEKSVASSLFISGSWTPRERFEVVIIEATSNIVALR
ncbi:MAG TPA: hypothetical protein VHE81_17605 [Lacipirellulaceae bacterium]|nr:hypothetical protein [Lacipirellulaceae bacterium]HWB49053.1 hypothetical protein [Stellaceae bacterium]